MTGETFELGQRDEQRFAALEAERRDYLLFLVGFCREILQRRPCQLEALICAADALTALGYYEAGLRLDIKLRQLRPADPAVAYNLACSLALTGQSEAALAILAEAVRLGYDDIEHMCEDPDLASLRELSGFRELVRAAKRRAAVSSEAAEGGK
ncbi:MAG: hypothetical protein N3A66_05280 [Planctomycetota bacterium]|nr:hypothetical protein [Planctomycetota bacterium]